MSKDVEALRDFCNMVCDYMEVDTGGINPLHGYAINYGEINWWAKKHHNMCVKCMEGDNDMANAADDFTQMMYEFLLAIGVENYEDKKD